MSLLLSIENLRSAAAAAHLAPAEEELSALLPALRALISQGEEMHSAASPAPEGISLSALRQDRAADPRTEGTRFAVPRVVGEGKGGQAQ